MKTIDLLFDEFGPKLEEAFNDAYGQAGIKPQAYKMDDVIGVVFWLSHDMYLLRVPVIHVLEPGWFVLMKAFLNHDLIDEIENFDIPRI